MRRKIALLLITLIILGVITPLMGVSAYTGGLLHGKALQLGPDHLSSLATTTVLTDGNLETSDMLFDVSDYPDYQDHVYYEFDTPVSLISYQLLGDSGSNAFEIFAILSNGTKRVIAASANQTGVLVNFPVVSNVKKIVLANKTNLNQGIFEFDVFLSPVTPPPTPTGLTGVAASGVTQLTWEPVVVSDLAGYNVYLNNVKYNTALITDTSASVTVSNNQNNTFQVTAVDTDGSESGRSNQVTSYFDTISPLSPIGLTSNPTGLGSTLLDWTDNEEPDLAGYNVYQDGSTKKNVSLIIPSEYLLTGLTANVTYSFTVTAVDNSDNESSQSASVTYFFDTDIPLQPTTLTGTADIYNVNLNWINSTSADVVGYNIYNGGNKVNQVVIVGNSYQVTNLQPETNYTFTVRAVDNGSNESLDSNPFQITTLPAPLMPPLTPQTVGTKIMNESVQVNYSTSLNAQFYNVYVDGVKHNQAPIYGTTYYVTPLVNGTTYNIQVTAENVAGESARTPNLNVVPSDKALPYITYTYNLKDVADSVGSWFGAYWLILVFALSIPLSFAIGQKVKQLF